MHYIIYFNQKPLLLTGAPSPKSNELLQLPGAVFQEELNDLTVRSMLQKMEDPNTVAGVFLHASTEKVLQAFKQNMKVIEAAGGFVHTNNKTILLIYRNSKWDLPKGKIEKGEATEAAAVREVQEETGLEHVQLETLLTATYHTYYQNGTLILKESHWFLMKSTEQQNLVPQQEEGIEKCEWVKQDALTPFLKNTHPSIIDVLQSGIEKLRTLKTF